MVKTIVFVSIIIIIILFKVTDPFLCQKPEISNPYNFITYDRILMKLGTNGQLYDAMLVLLFGDLDLLLQVKLEIGPKYFVTGLAKSRRLRIILATGLDGY